MTSHETTRRTPPFGPVLAVLAVALISINLRPGASSVGPLLEEVRTALAIGPTLAGVVTALPGFAFAVAGGGAVSLARRVGVSAGIALGVAAVVVTPWRSTRSTTVAASHRESRTLVPPMTSGMRMPRSSPAIQKTGTKHSETTSRPSALAPAPLTAV